MSVNVRDVYTADEFEIPVVAAYTGDPIPKVIHAQNDAQNDMREALEEEASRLAEEEAEELPGADVLPRRVPPSRPRRPRHKQGRREMTRTRHQANRTKQFVSRRR